MSKRLHLVSLVVLCIAVIFMFIVLLAWPAGVDWRETFYPATRAFASGGNPYHAVRTFANPVYALVPLLPMAVSLRLGSALLSLSALTALSYTIRKWGGGLWSLVLFLTLPTTVIGLWSGNIDWLPLLGTVAHTVAAIPLLLIKPQIGGSLTVFLAVRVLRRRGIYAMPLFAPALMLLAGSFVLYGFPSDYALSYPRLSGWNMATFWWPRGMVFATVLLLFAVATGKKRLALVASPYFMPYASWASWGMTLVVFVNRRGVMFFVWIVLWTWTLVHV